MPTKSASKPTKASKPVKAPKRQAVQRKKTNKKTTASGLYDIWGNNKINGGPNMTMRQYGQPSAISRASNFVGQKAMNAFSTNKRPTGPVKNGCAKCNNYSNTSRFGFW